jgi:hypothetical protein
MARFERRLAEEHGSLQSDLGWVYDSHEWVAARSLVTHLGNMAAAQDILEWLGEAQDLLVAGEPFEPVAMALYERVKKILAEPIMSLVHERFEQAQQETGVSFEGLRFPEAEYSDYFHSPRDTFSYYYLFNFTFSSLASDLEQLIALHRSGDPWDAVTLLNERWEREAEEASEEKLANVLDVMNSIISGRNTYGLRSTDTIESFDFSILAWSNGARSWSVLGSYTMQAITRSLFHGRKINVGPLDANYIMVPFPPPVASLVLTSLYPLPLYESSMEAKVEKRRAGKQGPLVSDRTIKRILLAVARNRKWTADSLWENLVKYKMTQDEEALDKLLERYGVENTPAFYGQIKNWFSGLQL